MKKIVCPHCNAEYNPLEIFIPESFFGSLKHIEKDENGKITEFLGEKMDVRESYKCDYCLRKFYIMADIKFEVEADPGTINKAYSTKLNKPNLFMKED